MTPPLITIGSFDYITSTFGNQFIRDVFIYWHNINENEKCHNSFEYLVYYTVATNDNTTRSVYHIKLKLMYSV